MKLLKGRFGGGGLILILLSLVIKSVGQKDADNEYLETKRTVYCVQVGQGDDKGPFTIGGKRFEPRDKLPMRLSSKIITKLGTHHIENTQFSNEDKKEWDEMPHCPGFDNYYYQPRNSFYSALCPVSNKRETNIVTSNITIRTYLVRQKRRVLRGWLHVEVEINNPDDEMEYIYVQMRDEDFNAIGEFVTKEEEQCKPSKKGLISPTQYQYLPCSATGMREVKTGQAIFMAKASQYANEAGTKGFIPTQELKRGIHFTWRMSEYWCNRHSRIRVDAEVWTKKNMINFAKVNEKNRQSKSPDQYCSTTNANQGRDCLLQRQISDWLLPKWYGAADIKLDGGGELDCLLPAIGSDDKISPGGNDWLDKAKPVQVKEDYMHTKNIYPDENDKQKHYVKSCEVDPNPKEIAKSDILSFGGRCKTAKDKDVAHSYFHGCKPGRVASKVESEFEDYNKYATKLGQERLKQCGHDCVLPDINNPQDLKDIQNFPGGKVTQTSTPTPSGAPNPKSTEGSVLLEKMKTERALEMRVIFWITRQCHGIVCIFLAMFLIPLSNFLARYYKETFTKGNWMGFKPWLGFHLLVCFLVPSFFYATLLPMLDNSENFGRSQSPHGTFHCTYGYVFIWTFIVMACIGGFRPVKPLPRLVCMALHSVAGFVLNIMAIILICQSAYIPASPSADECDPDSKLPTSFSFVSQMGVVRLCMDLGFHLFLTYVQKAVDKKNKIRRQGFALPFIPILPGTTLKDLVGYRFRRSALVVYMVLTFGVAFLCMWDLWEKEDNLANCTLGELSCNMSETLPNKASSPLGCSSTSIMFYAKYVARYP